MFRIDIDNIDGKTESLFVYGEKYILAELEDHNILINYNCRQGHCGRCILKLVNGDVEHNDHLIEISRNELLACRAKPTSDIKISLRD